MVETTRGSLPPGSHSEIFWRFASEKFFRHVHAESKRGGAFEVSSCRGPGPHGWFLCKISKLNTGSPRQHWQPEDA
jgi:hypothetical protein